MTLAGAYRRGQSRAVEEVGLEKSANIFTAGLAHILQNVAIKKMLGNPRFGAQLGQKFSDAVQGKPQGVLRTFLEGMQGGSLVPERSILQGQARQFGMEINQFLSKSGITRLTSRDSVIGRALLRGDIDKAIRFAEKYNSPASRALLAYAAKKMGVPVEKLYSAYKAGKFVKGMVGDSTLARDVSAVWRNPEKSPLTANILSQIFSTKKIDAGKSRIHRFLPINAMTKGQVASEHAARLAGNTAGAGIVGTVDPITAGMNLSKSVMTNPISKAVMDNTPGVNQALRASEHYLAKEPVTRAFQQGVAGTPPSKYQKFHELFGLYGKNALIEEASRSARNIGQAIGQNLPLQVRREMGPKQKGPGFFERLQSAFRGGA